MFICQQTNTKDIAGQSANVNPDVLSLYLIFHILNYDGNDNGNEYKVRLYGR